MSNQGALNWHKSSYSGASSGGDGSCIEQGEYPDGKVAVRDTKDHCTGSVLGFSPTAWAAFIGGTAKAA